MRARGFWTVAMAGGLAACAPEAVPAPQGAASRTAPPPEADAGAVREPAPQYVVGDPARSAALSVLPAGEDATGVTVDGVRFVLRGGSVRVARDVGEAPLQQAWAVPARLGGGFLFRAKGTLYASEAYDGLLRPVAAVPGEVTSVSFGPRAALVRADSGERWSIDLATGRRLPIAPPGLLDVAALDDGRAAALVEGGRLLVSADAGAHWTDATSRLRAPATRVLVSHAQTTHEASLWIETSSGTLGLLRGERLADFDGPPRDDPAPPLRAKQPAWREDEAPIRRALRAGAPGRDGAALVVSGGDLVQVDVVSGAVEVVAAGKLPPDATCIGTRTQDDVVFTCGRSSGPAFVVSHAIDRAPVVEQTLGEAGRFVVGDDGGILWAGPCERPPGPPAASAAVAKRAACVRAAAGGWQEYDLDGAGEAGAGSTYDLVRWVPRADGGALAVVSNVGGAANAWGIVDARSGELHAWPPDSIPPALRSALAAGPSGSATDPSRLADRSWTVTAQGTLRGWATLGSALGAVEIGVDGSVQTSPFTFERIASAGAIALARMRDGRVWQTLDRGATWSEVAAPPAGRPSGWIDPHGCSLVGCDLGAWYRIGWAPTPPAAAPQLTTAPPAPRIDRAVPLEMTCRAAGDPRRTSVPRDERSPDDLGLGASRVAVADARGRTDFLRIAFARRVVGAVRDTETSDDAAPRARVHGPATQPGEDRLVVSGPVRDAMALVRQVTFVPAFDPAGTLRRGPIAMRDLVAAAAAGGVARSEVLRDDPVPSAVVPVTPADPSAPDDLLVQIADGGLAVLPAARAGATRIAYEAGRSDEWRVVSAASLDGGGLAWLEENSAGRIRVLRLGGRTPAPAFEMDGLPSVDLAPANVDALAVGPRGELGVLRAPSGGEPASALDPAFVLLPGAPPLALAPWATLAPADDPACRADAAGWRATLQTAAPWIRVSGAGDLAGADDSPMLLRVRWSPARVCLEAVEARTQDMALAIASPSQWGTAWDGAIPSWVVARFAGGASAGRVVVVAGGELRQPLECKLGAP